MRNFAYKIVYSTIFTFFLFLQIVYTRDTHTDFDANYVMPCKDVAF